MAPRNAGRAASIVASSGRTSLVSMTCAVGVVGVARFAELQGEVIQLGAVHDIGHGLGRGAERHRQQAGRQRVQRAAMAGFLRIEQALDAVDHVRAGHPGRLVDDQPPVERAAARLAAGHDLGTRIRREAAG